MWGSRSPSGTTRVTWPRSGSTTGTSSCVRPCLRTSPPSRCPCRTSKPPGTSGAGNCSSSSPPAAAWSRCSPNPGQGRPVASRPGRRTRPPRCLVDFQITRQHRRFVEFADAVRRHRYIGVCYGAPGLGKTLSARTYAAADDYEYWFTHRYHRASAMPASLVDSRTLMYTPELTITARRLNLEVGLHVHHLSHDIERALNPGYDLSL